MSDLAPLLTGLALSSGFIVAIGAQNAFVLRHGLRREHVGAVVAFCAIADLALIAAGVAGLGVALNRLPDLVSVLSLSGAAFLGCYGLAALHRAARPARLVADAAGSGLTLGGALARAAGFTLLNPHVYLHTVLLLGSVGAALPQGSQVPFVAGAGVASAAWFAALGFGASLVAPLFARPTAWRVLDLRDRRGHAASRRRPCRLGARVTARSWPPPLTTEPCPMYVPPAFRMHELPELHRVIQEVRLATLETATDEGLMATPLPLFLALAPRKARSARSTGISRAPTRNGGCRRAARRPGMRPSARPEGAQDEAGRLRPCASPSAHPRRPSPPRPDLRGGAAALAYDALARRSDFLASILRMLFPVLVVARARKTHPARARTPYFSPGFEDERLRSHPCVRLPANMLVQLAPYPYSATRRA